MHEAFADGTVSDRLRERLGGFDKIGIDGPWDVMRIVGTVPVEPDGSASFRVPANTPLAVQPLDERGRALQLMRSWFTVMPGEVKSCVGCHESQNTAPLLRQVQALRGQPGEIAPWYGPPRGFDFEREVQPVLDKYCVSCHDGKQTTVGGRAKPDLRALALRPDYKGILTNVPQWYDAEHLQVKWDADLQRIGKRKHVPLRFTPAYEALIRYVRRTGPEGDYHLLEPTEYYADTSLLMQILEKQHYGVKLDQEAWDRLVTWIDLNVPCHGTWSEVLPIPFDAVRRKRDLAKKYADLDHNPEAIPSTARKPVEAVALQQIEVKQGDTKALGWPFDCYEARLRQQAAGPRTERTIDLGGGQTMKLVLIPPGEFIMGNAYDGSPDEWPQTRVRIERPFWIGACEVTNEQFQLFDPDHHLVQDGKQHLRPQFAHVGLRVHPAAVGGHQVRRE
jgi:cytochrome c553